MAPSISSTGSAIAASPHHTAASAFPGCCAPYSDTPVESGPRPCSALSMAVSPEATSTSSRLARKPAIPHMVVTPLDDPEAAEELTRFDGRCHAARGAPGPPAGVHVALRRRG